MIVGVVSNSQDLEDLTQETFLRIFDGMDKHPPAPETLSTWVYRIAYNTALNFVNKWQPSTVSIEEIPIDTLDISEASLSQEFSCEDDEHLQALEQAFNALSAEDQFVINLYYFEEKPVEECAQILGVTSNGFYHRLRKVRKKLYNNIIR
ncbi:MAG: sigma-70 family RNA polymerase sigma factor [Bacteroidaceae bacterium]|nr:sigma-70 family RNA polymerase sigma factor [Bacteroidaceae bacterium]